jgi:hypothetical protein
MRIFGADVVRTKEVISNTQETLVLIKKGLKEKDTAQELSLQTG